MTADLEYLERVRHDLGLTTVAFVKLLPMHRTTYYGWLRGRTPDKLRMALCLARVKKLEASKI